jgi:hypothetical protein
MAQRIPFAGLIAAALLGLSSAASAQVIEQMQPAPPVETRTQDRLTARAPDLRPIPSRIEHGVVSVRNAGSAASPASIATVNCHLPGQEGGCPEIPAAAVAPYENPAYPNRVVVNIPAIPAGHVHSHNLTFWDEVDWPSGSYVFEFVVDAGATVGETNEGNNTGSHTWVVP